MWRVIPGFEHYAVSSEGRVRSLARLVQMKTVEIVGMKDRS